MPIEHDHLLRLLLTQRLKLLGFIDCILGAQGAEDVFQDVCVLAMAKRQEIKDEAHLLGWLRVAARLRSKEVLRERGRAPVLLGDDVLDLLDRQWQEVDGEESSGRSEVVRACLARLPENSRQLVERRYGDGMTVAQIAKELLRPIQSVYVSFSRVHAMLGDCIMRGMRVQREAGHE